MADPSGLGLCFDEGLMKMLQYFRHVVFVRVVSRAENEKMREKRDRDDGILRRGTWKKRRLDGSFESVE